MSSDVKRPPLVFLTVLFVLCALSLWLRFQFNFNAGHMDEYDYLFVGKRLLAGESWPTHTYIFGSDLNWYLLGLGDQWLGGLVGGRMIAGGFGLLSLLGIYWFTFNLWRCHMTAFVATALLSVQSIQLFLSRFATYDILSFAFFALALAPLMIACANQTRARYIYLLMAVVLMSLAIISKYVAILYLPFVAGLAFLYSRKVGIIFGGAVGILLLGYGFVHWESLQVLYKVQLQGVHGVGNSSTGFILDLVLRYLIVLIFAAFLAIVWSMKSREKPFWRHDTFKTLFVLFILAWPIALYHLHSLNMIALVKHLVYASLFLVPMMAWLLTRLVDWQNGKWLVQVVVSGCVIGMCFVNYKQLKALEQGYADVAPIIQHAEKTLVASDTILSEDPYLFRYLGMPKIPQDQIKESGWLDNDLDGKHEHQDVVDAVWDRKFFYVFLNDQLHPALNEKLRKILKMRDYELVINDPYQNSDVMSHQTTGSLSLYKRLKDTKLSLNGADASEKGTRTQGVGPTGAR